MAQPFVRRNTQAAESLGARPLTDICVDALIRYSKFLGDVGWIETKHLRKICPHLTRAELESIEDMTLEGSRRDLSWYTWHCWFRIYKSLYGQPQPAELLPLPGEPPADYEAPKIDSTPGSAATMCDKGYFVVPYGGAGFHRKMLAELEAFIKDMQPMPPRADYRGMILVREQAEEDRKAAAVSRLRAGYNTENHKRLAHGVEYTTKLPPPKRAKLHSPGAVLQKQLAEYNTNKTLGGRPAVKVMKDLGLAGKEGSSRSGSGSKSKQSIYSWTGKSSAPKQTHQPSALACLAKNKPAASATGRAVEQISHTLQHRLPQQQPPGLQEKHRPGKSGSVHTSQPAARAAAVHSHPGSVAAKQRSNTARLGLLDTPVALGRASAGMRRS